MAKKRIPTVEQIPDTYRLYKHDDDFMYFRHPTKNRKVKIEKGGKLWKRIQQFNSKILQNN